MQQNHFGKITKEELQEEVNRLSRKYAKERGFKGQMPHLIPLKKVEKKASAV